MNAGGGFRWSHDGIRGVVRGGSPLDPAAGRILLNTSRSSAAELLTAREREVLILLAVHELF